MVVAVTVTPVSVPAPTLGPSHGKSELVQFQTKTPVAEFHVYVPLAVDSVPAAALTDMARTINVIKIGSADLRLFRFFMSISLPVVVLMIVKRVRILRSRTLDQLRGDTAGGLAIHGWMCND
jgi:hypothetical protein